MVLSTCQRETKATAKCIAERFVSRLSGAINRQTPVPESASLSRETSPSSLSGPVVCTAFSAVVMGDTEPIVEREWVEYRNIDGMIGLAH